MEAKTKLARVQIEVVKNGYLLRLAGHEVYITAGASDDYVFETLDSLFKFLEKELLTPPEKAKSDLIDTTAGSDSGLFRRAYVKNHDPKDPIPQLRAIGTPIDIQDTGDIEMPAMDPSGGPLPKGTYTV